MTSRTYAIARTLAFCSLAGLAVQASAQRGGGGRAGAGAGTHHRSTSTHHANRSAAGTHTANRTNVNRNVTANNVNVNRNVTANNVNVNRNVNVNAHGGYGYGYGAHPVARGAVAGATAAVVMGSYYRTLPAGCTTVNHGGVIYHHCGSTWYRTEGSQYLVVPQP